MSFQPVCLLEDLGRGKPFAASVDSVDVVLVLVGDEVYALADECSHGAVPLSEGEVEGRTIECWHHGSLFDLATGRPLSLPATDPVPAYQTKIDGDLVLVDVTDPLVTQE